MSMERGIRPTGVSRPTERAGTRPTIHVRARIISFPEARPQEIASGILAEPIPSEEFWS